MKILSVVGARPQFIKSAMVEKELLKHSGVENVVVHTGQHPDKNMSEIFFSELGLSLPKYNLGVSDLSHGAMTGRMLEGIEKVLLKERPQIALVYGDTNSTLAGALASAKLGIPLAHVEAGLRSYKMTMPEEINRILSDRVSAKLFCPTDNAVSNLIKEGYNKYGGKIIKCGDVMFDAVKHYSQISQTKSKIVSELGIKEYVLCTIHRAENTDDAKTLMSIIKALNKINRDVQVIIPLHPRTKKVLNAIKPKVDFKIIEPVGYLSMLELIGKCSLVITDSGGVQKEAFFLKKHCVTVREETEWVELVENGYNILAGSDEHKIFKAFHKMINKKSNFGKCYYGNGNASLKIVEELML